MSKKCNVGIIGLGYVGAPLAYLTATCGYNVVGIDNNSVAIENINKRINIPTQLTESLKKNSNINLVASNNYSLLSTADIIIICVPTPTKNNNPDLSIMKSVISKICNFIQKGCLLIIESTVAPGMTRKYIEEYLRNESKLIVNKDYDLAYCPERIDPRK